jgi:hypothetical protein
MLDIVPPNQNKLPLSVDIEGVHHPKARLACAPTRWPDTAREHRAHDQEQHK